MVKIKNILNDVVDNTYEGSEKIDQYKKFYVEIIDKNMRGKHGDYHEKTHHIRIFNLYRDDNAIVATTIHELAHHVDNVNRGSSDHSKEFYAVFKELLYTALDMKLFNKEEFLAANRDASDSNKIAKMIGTYVPTDIGYKSESKLVMAKNCYLQKDVLKGRKYMFNKINSSWEKELPIDELDAEQEYLKEIGVEYEVGNPNDISFQKKSYLLATKGSYDYKDALKKDGFFYTKESKGWKKEMSAEDANIYKEKFPKVNFVFQK